MRKSGLELKVGVFVLVCLFLAALLMLQFGKGTTFFRPTYQILLNAKNVGGLKARASVLVAGVQVGTVTKNQLSEDGKSVTITLKIFGEFKIYPDARFVIEQSGFLGDQYVAVYPTANEGEPMHEGSLATAREPFNLQEAAQSAKGFIDGVNATARKLDAAVDDIRRLVLNETTLSNLAVSVTNLRQVTEEARATVTEVRQLVASNATPASLAVSNLVAFSERLDRIGDSAQAIVNSNKPTIAMILGNIQASSESLTNIIGNINAGHGLVGKLLSDEELGTNFAATVSSLSQTSSNLNQLGLWRLFFPKHPAKPAPAKPNPKP